MLKRSGLLLAFATIFLQFAVFLQPLLPEQYQISPVCETIEHSLLRHYSSPLHDQTGQFHLNHRHLQADQLHEDSISDHHHDIRHECPYCTFYGNLILPPELVMQEILVRIQIRLLAFAETFQHIYFQLQRLFLIPQGRAPPLILT